MIPSPQVSVVLPFRGMTLDDALCSIGAQTMPGFECLLVDNGSLDGSSGIAHAAARRDARFRLLRSDGGLVAALNAGIAAARAPLIARMDADDLAHPARLERQLQALQGDPGLSVASCLVGVGAARSTRCPSTRHMLPIAAPASSSPPPAHRAHARRSRAGCSTAVCTRGATTWRWRELARLSPIADRKAFPEGATYRNAARAARRELTTAEWK